MKKIEINDDPHPNTLPAILHNVFIVLLYLTAMGGGGGGGLGASVPPPP